MPDNLPRILRENGDLAQVLQKSAQVLQKSAQVLQRK